MLHRQSSRLAKLVSFALPILLVACSSSSSDDDNAVIPHPTITSNLDPNLPPEDSVEGVWSTTCFFNDSEGNDFYQINTYKRQELETFYIERRYETRGCTNGFYQEKLLIGVTTEVGTVVEPIFGVSATSVLVTPSDAFINAVLANPVPDPFYDLIYRSGETIRLGLAGSEDADSNIPQQLNWILAHRYVESLKR